jgi:SAM-dependent methyltransferase/thiamine kinase-like enzyme
MTRKEAEVAEAGREQLRENAQAFLANTKALSGLEIMISARLGTPVRHVRSEPVPRHHAYLPRMRRWQRAYTKHWFEPSGAIDPGASLALDTDGRLVVFAKSATNLRTRPDLETLLSDRRDKGFRVPYFFGCFEEAGLRIGAWEFIQTNRVAFKSQPWENQARIVRAIARVNSLPVEPGAVAPMREWKPSANWFGPAFEQLDAPSRAQWAELHARSRKAVKLQDAFFEKVRSLGAGCLTHNDVDMPNLVVPAAGDVVLFDWDNATLGAAGIDLRAIVRAGDNERLLSLYVDEMAAHGHRVALEHVRLAAEVTNGYWLLRYGWMQHKKWQVARALELIEGHLASAKPRPVPLLKRIAARLERLGQGAGTASAPGTAGAGKPSERAHYRDRYANARCEELLRVDKGNEAAVMSGTVPPVFARLVPLVPGRRVLEIGAGEGILSLALAAEKERVIGIDLTPVRHEKAKHIQAAWRSLGRDVDRCEFVLGDVFERRELFRGMDTLLACHVIYYFRERLDEFMQIVRENVRYVCLIGNTARARHYKSGDLSRLGGYEYYSTTEGMKDLLQRHGFVITYESDERTPVVVGELRDASADR